MSENEVAGDPKRQRHVPKEMERLEKAVDTLMSVVGEMETKLSSILTDPKPDKAEDEKTIFVVPLANTIREARYKIDTQSNQLGNILARLEL